MEIKEYEKVVIENERTVSVGDFWRACKRKWKWFVGCVVSCCALALLFILVATPQYERYAALIIKDESSGGNLLSAMSSSMGMLAGMAGLNITSNVNNELEVFRSPATMMEVVKRLDMDVTYKVWDGLQRKELYDETLPIKVTYPALTEKDGAYMKMDLRKDGTFTVYKFRLNKDKFDGEVQGQVNNVVKTPIGKIAVTKTPHFDKFFKEDGEKTIRIMKYPRYDMTDLCMKKLTAELEDDQTSVISLGYQDMSSDRAERIINTLITVYQENYLKDKNAAAEESADFLNERIASIEGQLQGIDSEISRFRGKNLIPDYEATAKAYLENAAMTNEAVMKLSNQLYVMEHMQKFLKNENNKDKPLPANIVPDNESVGKQIAEYNKLLMQRNEMLSNSSEKNPLVESTTAQIEAMRTAIDHSLGNAVAQARIMLQNVMKEDNKITSKLATAPDKVVSILPAERKQKLIEALYIYLLQKKEENNLSQIFNSKNTRIITPPMGKLKPVFPKKIRTMAAAGLLGLLLPGIFIFIGLSNGRKFE